MSEFRIVDFKFADGSEKPRNLRKLDEISSFLESCKHRTCTGVLKYRDGRTEMTFLFVGQAHLGQVFLKAPSGEGPLYDLEQRGRKLFMKDE
jgi:hypothetical protein